MSIAITNYIVFQLSNYNYNKNYFKNCNQLQLIIITNYHYNITDGVYTQNAYMQEFCYELFIHVSRLQPKEEECISKTPTWQDLSRVPNIQLQFFQDSSKPTQDNGYYEVCAAQTWMWRATIPVTVGGLYTLYVQQPNCYTDLGKR